MIFVFRESQKRGEEKGGKEERTGIKKRQEEKKKLRSYFGVIAIIINSIISIICDRHRNRREWQE